MGDLKRIRDFKPATDQASADELRRQLGQFEDNVSDMGDRLKQAAMARLSIKTRDGRVNTLTVGPGQSLGIDASVTRVQLDPPQIGDAGKFVAICKGTGAAVNTTISAPASSTINGAATFVIATAGVLQLFYCDGINYWTKP